MKIREVEVKIAKHRKLLNRAVGNHLLPVINYHHYQIVELIKQKGKLEQEERDERMKHPIVGVFGDAILKELLKLQDKEIMGGRIS